MNRRTARVAVVALLAVLALGFGAATLNSATDTGGSGAAGSQPVRDLVNRTPGLNQPPPEDNRTATGGGLDTSIPGGCVKFLQSPLFIWGAVAVIAGSLLYIRRRHGTAGAAFVLFSAFLPLLLIVYAIFASCGDISLPGGGIPSANITRVAEGLSAGTVRSPESPPLLVFGVVLVAVALLGIVLLRQAQGGTAADIVPEEEEADEETLEALGAAAGEAADRIEAQADVDNEVYRAWGEMASLVDADRPETSTPGEFADAAVAVGMDPADVEELTRLFEEVRYGDAPPTEERERRAVAALRNIEDAYGGPSADPDYDAENEGGGE